MFAFLFKLAGWKTAGYNPVSVPKAIWVVAPHTSNGDFFVGLGVRADLKTEIGFLAKSQLFEWYSGWLFRALGGHPVYRDKSNNLVGSVVKLFQDNSHIHIAIAPEGTRKDVVKLKTGFYFMALGAGVPLMLTCFNHRNKTVTVSSPCYLTGDYQRDMKVIYDFFLIHSDTTKTWLDTYEKTNVIPPVPAPVS